LNNFKASQICELVLISGGFYYHLARSFHHVFDQSLPAGFIGVRRVLGKNPRAVISYDNLEAVPDNSLTIIGDTIATGATLVDSIRYYLTKTPKVKKILIFTIAGATKGAQELAQLEKEIQRRYGTKLYVFFSDGLFGLSENQTDMFYCHPEAKIAPESLAAADKELGKVLVARMCVIWDWGQRNKSPVKHLQEVIRVCRKFGKHGSAIARKAKAKLIQKNKKL